MLQLTYLAAADSNLDRNRTGNGRVLLVLAQTFSAGRRRFSLGHPRRTILACATKPLYHPSRAVSDDRSGLGFAVRVDAPRNRSGGFLWRQRRAPGIWTHSPRLS